ncbi:MAG TPA: chemotaxis protein CheW [Candidatus Baltobacteraceae bacterium]|nr:chemotaxis protein CheW [Candidatus Baltobacteraceae bacterium]
MSGTAGTKAKESAAPTALQMLFFEVAGKAFALDLVLVDRVIEALAPVRTPRRPAFVDGVIEDRGRYLAVFNLRRRFGLPEPGRSHTAIVLLRGLDLDPLIGLTVDRVLQVLSVAPDVILTPPPRVFGIRAEYLHGVANISGWPVVWLDIAKVLTTTEPMTLLQ